MVQVGVGQQQGVGGAGGDDGGLQASGRLGIAVSRRVGGGAVGGAVAVAIAPSLLPLGLLAPTLRARLLHPLAPPAVQQQSQAARL